MAFSDMRHRKWFKGPTGGHSTWRKMKASVQVARAGDTGESKVLPYRAITCVGGGVRGKRAGGFYPRNAATRCGEARGRTPTLAIRGAFKDLGKVFK